ncbi:MAG: alpha/beta fold hydrolase [Pseudohongiellaceae bacterium]|jgi:pimeloyl-ACP methyl ester carboxylesterase
MPVLYLLPGLLCDARVWVHQCAHLADLVECRVPDFRQCDSLDAMADVVLADAHERFYVAGHSMGGRVAMQVLSKAPERVIKLALLDTGIHPAGNSSGEPEKRQALIDLAEREGMAALARQWGLPMLHPDRHSDTDLVDTFFGMIESYSLDSYKGQVKALLERPDAKPFLARAPADTLVLCGREDTWSTPAQHEDIAAALPDHPDVVVIEHSGHMVSMEQPDAVTKALRDWLERE